MLVQAILITAVLVILALRVGKLFVLVAKGERSATTGWIVGLGLVAIAVFGAFSWWFSG